MNEELRAALDRFSRTQAPADLGPAVAALDGLPVAEHPEAYEALHQDLRSALDRRATSVPEGLLRERRRDSESSGGSAADQQARH